MLFLTPLQLCPYKSPHSLQSPLLIPLVPCRILFVQYGAQSYLLPEPKQLILQSLSVANTPVCVLRHICKDSRLSSTHGRLVLSYQCHIQSPRLPVQDHGEGDGRVAGQVKGEMGSRSCLGGEQQRPPLLCPYPLPGSPALYQIPGFAPAT